MYTGQVKVLLDKKWQGVPISDLVGTTVIQYMINTSNRCVAALKIDDKPCLFIVNSKIDEELLTSKAPCFFAKDLATFLLGNVANKIVLDVFGDCEFEAIVKEEV